MIKDFNKLEKVQKTAIDLVEVFPENEKPQEG